MNHFQTIALFRIRQEAESLVLSCALPACGCAFLAALCASMRYDLLTLIFAGLAVGFVGCAIGAFALGRKLG